MMPSSCSHVPKWRRTLRKHAKQITNPPAALRAVIASCLCVDPMERPTSDEVFYEFIFLADSGRDVGGEAGPLSIVSEGGEETDGEDDEGELESLSGTNNSSAQRVLRARFVGEDRQEDAERV